MAKYKGKSKRELLDRNQRWQASGCSTWSIFNAGNTLISIDNAIVLYPGETYEGPEMHPDVELQCEFDITFANVGNYAIEDFAATAGPIPAKIEISPENPTPGIDRRCVISSLFVTPV